MSEGDSDRGLAASEAHAGIAHSEKIDPISAPAPPMQPAGGEAASRAPSAGDEAAAEHAAAPPLVDPAVTRIKFEREIRNYRTMESEYQRRGWLLLRAEYPEAVVLFAAPQLAPPPLLVGVVINFINYDFWPPSVRFVNPFTLARLRGSEMPIQLLKRVPGDPPVQHLIQQHADQVPFLCVRGVREYHHHPFHSNNPWLAQRGAAAGTLYDILNIIWLHGVVPIKHYAVQFGAIGIGLQRPMPADIPE